ncbi:unnamed protein product, partial [Sphacelaria rigidula]
STKARNRPGRRDASLIRNATTPMKPNKGGGDMRGSPFNKVAENPPSSPPHEQALNPPRTATFQTAGGRGLHISAEAIARVSHLFEDESGIDDGESPGMASAAPA